MIKFDDRKSHMIQDAIDVIIDKLENNNDTVLANNLRTVRDSIPCSCGVL